MLMNRSEERELFLSHIVDTYLRNPSLSISQNIIYGELSRFSTYGGKHNIIDKDSIIGVQVGLNNRFKLDNRARTFTARNGYFWAIENRMGKSDEEFLADMYNSIKLYISVDFDNIYRVSELLFKFMLNEGIVMQCKIAKNMRNDALVCRVVGRTAADKVCEYLNGLNYECRFRPNPFFLENGRASVAMDGSLSYNAMLAKLLEQYFELRKDSGQLDRINCDDFNIFVTNQIAMFNGKTKDYFMNLYDISDKEKCMDFLMICNQISKNLDGSLSLNELYKYSEIRDVDGNGESNKYSKNAEDKILYVINSLTNYYSVIDVHKIIMKFIETGDIRLFTRKDDIRTVVCDNFSKEDVKRIISDIGWKAFIGASKVTYDKYGKEQLFCAIKDVFNGDGINRFTNDYNARSRLGLVIPQELLKDVIVNKLNESGMNISSANLANLVMGEIEKEDNKKGFFVK